MKKCDICQSVIPESDSESIVSVGRGVRGGYPVTITCPTCEGDSVGEMDYECWTCANEGRVNVCRECEVRIRGQW